MNSECYEFGTLVAFLLTCPNGIFAGPDTNKMIQHRSGKA